MEKGTQQFPKKRFPQFNGEWRSSQLGDFAITVTSGSRDWAQYYSDEGSKFIRMTNLTREGIQLLLDDLKFVKLDEDSSEGKRTSLEENDILISITAELGKIGIVPADFGTAYINQHTALVRLNSEKADARFVAHKLSSKAMNNKINRLNDSGAKSGLNLPTIRSFTIAIPTIPEQQKIADFLTAVDRRIGKLVQKKALLEGYKKGVMQQLFTQAIRFQDDHGNDFPDWEEKKLGEVFEEIKECVGDKELTPYSISAGKGLVSQNEKFGRVISGQQHERYICLKPSEFTYNKGASKKYRYGCVYPNPFDQEIAVPNVFISFRPIVSIATAFYAKLFEHHHLDRGLRRLISSSARLDGLLNLNKGDFFALRIPYPSPDEQTKIADFLSAIDRKIESVATQITETQTFKRGLLQQMFV